MAASQIDIKIRTLIEGVQGIQQLVAQLNALSSGASAVNPAAQGAANAMKGIGDSATNSQGATGGLANILSQLNGVTNQTKEGLVAFRSDLKGLEGGFESLTGYAQKAALAFVAFLAVQGVKEMADYAARTETLGVTLDVVAKNAGYTKDEISKYETELKKLGITTQAARESMTAMIQAGIPLEAQAGQSASNVARLARAAQDLAVVTGENSSETLRRLTTNIQQMDTMGLRFMGLTVDIMAAQDRYAASIGTTREALTQQQKVMAVNNAALEESAKLNGAYEASMETVGKKVASLKRYQEELANTMGDKLLPAYGAVVDSATTLLSTLNKLAEGTDKGGEASRHFGEVVGTLTNSLSDVITMVARFSSENSDLFESLASNLVGIITDVVEFVQTLMGASESAGIWKATLWGAALAVAGLRDGLKVLEATLLYISGAFNGVFGDILKGMAAVAKATGFSGAAQGLSDMAQSFHEVAAASDKAASKIVDDFAAGRTATQSFLEGTDKIALSLSNFGKASSFKQVTDELANLADAARNGEGATENFGKASSLAAGDVTKLIESGKLSKEQIEALVVASKQAGVVLPDQFNTAAKAVKSLTDEAAKTKAILETVGSGTNFAGVETEINALIKAQARGIGTSTEHARAFDILTESIKSMGEKGVLSSQQMGGLDKKLKSVGANITTEYQAAIKDMGLSVGELTTGMSDKFANVAKSMERLAGNAQTTAETFSAAFSKNIDTAKSVAELEALSASIVTAKNRGDELIAQGKNEEGAKWLRASAEAAGEAKVKFEALFETSLKASKTQDDFVKLTAQVKKFADETGQSSEWVATRLDMIGEASKRVGQDVQNADISGALKKIGMSAEEMRGQATRSIQDVVGALRELATSANVTGDEYYKAFSKSVGMAKSISDLQAFKGELQTTLNEGKIGWDEYASGLQKVGTRFDELFQAQLKSAKTKEDFAQLRAEVQRLGESGSISGTQVALALQQISQQASGTQALIAKMNQDALNNARAMGAIAQAQNGVLSAGLDVAKAKNDLAASELQNAREGTAVSQADVQIKQAALAVAKAHQQTQIAVVELKKQELALQQAMQGLATAQAAFEKDGSDANRQAVATAQQQVTAKQQVVVESQKAVQEAQNEEESLKGAVIVASQLKAEMAGAAAATGESVRDTAAVAQALNDMLPLYGKVNARLKEAGYATEEASKYAKDLTDTFGRLSGSWVDLWIRADDVERKTRELEETKKRQIALEEKQAKVMAEQEKVATKIKDAYNGVREQAEYAQLGISGWSAGANAVQKAYLEIQKSAASAAKSATDAARSFVSSSTSIHEELLSAMGREDEAIQSRYESRKRDLTLQYEQLKIQIQIAKIQAQAAKVSTAGLDAAASEAQESYNRALSELGQLEAIARKKAADDAAKKAAEADAKKNTTASAESDSTTDNQPQQISGGGVTRATAPAEPVVTSTPQPVFSSSQMGEFTDAVSSMADSAGVMSGGAFEVGNAMSSAVEGSMGGFEGVGSAMLSGSFSGGGDYAMAGGSMNAVDVSRVDISFNGASASVYTEPGQSGDLISILQGVKNRALG